MPTTQPPPGLLRREIDPDVVMMICTAGHVDHGKTELVRLLTGCQTDRLKVEQERGMTIELGFAPCGLGGTLCVGIVDVPGHEKFVKNMVAGVSGIGAAILVVAADDGIMPQTIEHVQIMALLGVQVGLVALTKIDLVDAAMIEQRCAELTVFLEGTFLAGAPICPVSARTFIGYDEFYGQLVECIRSACAQESSRHSREVFRMPVERFFSRPGFGTIVSGIPVAGHVRVGDTLQAVPGGRQGRVRAIQRFQRKASEGGAGQCLALNIPEFSNIELGRNQALSPPGWLTPAVQLHARVRAVSNLDPPLRNAEEIRLHSGTANIGGRIYLLEDELLTAGRDALVSILLDEPVAAAPHDLFILRRPSPAHTVGGGRILLAGEHPRRPPRRQMVERLTEFEQFFAGTQPHGHEWDRRRIEYFLWREAPYGTGPESVARALLLQPEVVREELERQAAAGMLLPLSDGSYIHPEAYQACFTTAAERVRAAETSGAALSLRLSDLRRGLNWSGALWTKIEQDLAQAGLVRAQAEKIILTAAASRMNATEQKLMEQIEATYRETGCQSPRPDELAAHLGAPNALIERLLDHLCDEGRLVRVAKNVLLEPTCLRQAQARVVAIIRARGVLNSADFKHEIQSTRKYALAILDWLDARRVTLRLGNDRKLTADYEKRLW